MLTYHRVLTIAGSDSGGGAGIQADIKTISAIGCYASSAITCITAQNTIGVQAVEPLSIKIIESQIRSVLDDIGADAVKIGMLGSPSIARCVARILSEYRVSNIVLDPVLVATSGDELTTTETIDVIVNELMPLAAVTTPNLIEAERMAPMAAGDSEATWDALRARGARALLIKGGHDIHNLEMVTDLLFTIGSTEPYLFSSPRIDTVNTHGTGCTLSSAIASYLAHGFDLVQATDLAKDYIYHAIASAREYKLGHGHGPVDHFYKTRA